MSAKKFYAIGCIYYKSLSIFMFKMASTLKELFFASHFQYFNYCLLKNTTKNYQPKK
jgi:hypothetical protein